MSRPNKNALAAAGRAIDKIALEKHISPEQVRKEISESIAAGMANEDPKVQKLWDAIPREGNVPTPEEVIAYYSSKLKHLS